jgi:hypothetical protein
VRLLPAVPNVTGVIDVMSVTDERPFQPFINYPPVGAQVLAVAMPYPPNGQLRLSTRNSDIDPVLEGDSGLDLTGRIVRWDAG